MMSKTVHLEDDATRSALTRVLAIESRNALARVELAASELSRFGATPSAFDRISTIHHAVAEIDEYLAKIDVLAAPKFLTCLPAIEIDEIWLGIRKRLDPILRARGIAFHEVDELAVASHLEPTVEMPRSSLEAILYALLRLVMGPTGQNLTLSFEALVDDSDIRISLTATAREADRSDWDISREERLELEVQLAEWGGSVEFVSTHDRDGVQLRLPAGATNG